MMLNRYLIGLIWKTKQNETKLNKQDPYDLKVEPIPNEDQKKKERANERTKDAICI